MTRVNLARAKATLSELVDRAEAGETVEIVRRGKLAARLVPPVAERQPLDVEALKRLAESLPREQESSGEFMRRLRDDARY